MLTGERFRIGPDSPPGWIITMPNAVRISLPCGPLSVVVLAGGSSAEREVSLESGRSVAVALRDRGHQVELLDPAHYLLASYPWERCDVAFIALHGGSGEDGTVQALLARRGVPYTGSGPVACRLAMSKRASKARFMRAGVQTPPAALVTPDRSWREIRRQAAAVGYPLVAKPDRQGSSVGLSIVHEPAELERAVEHAGRFDPVVLLERFVPGRELTVALFGLRLLPIIEIQYYGDYFSYRAKYHDGDTRYVVPANLQPAIVERVRDQARRAVLALGCCGLTRVDMRLDPAGRPWILEVNAVPGLTGHSLVPMAAQAAGITFGELCEWMLAEAIARRSLRRAA